MYEVEITQYPVESGIDLTDNVNRRPTTLHLEGKIVTPNASRIRAKLLDVMYAGKRVDYIGRNTFKKVLIRNFESIHDAEIANGMRFTATLQEVRVADPSYSALNGKTKAAAKTTTNAGRQQLQKQKAQGPKYHTMKRGESFYSIAPKYGTTWQAIQKLNSGVDPKKLRVGQKVRVA